MDRNIKCSHIPGNQYFSRFIRYLIVLLCSFGMFISRQAIAIPLPDATPQPTFIPTISGPATVCSATGGHIYTTEPGMSNYVWTITAGGAITSGSGTNIIVVTWSQVGTGTITVSYSTASGPGTLDVSVLPVVIPAITISPSANPICAGTPVTYTATIDNGGSSPVFQWMVNGVPVGTNSSIYSYNASDGDVVTCSLTSNILCASSPQVVSLPVTMIVNSSMPAGVFIIASSNPVCQGTSVTFTAVPQNGGTAPVFQWKLNGTNTGTNSTTLSLVPDNGDLITCEMMSNASCVSGNPAISNTIIMNVGSSQPVSIAVIPSANPVCEGSSVTYTASVVNGGSAPQYLWKVNGINAGSGSGTFTHTPSDGDAITCQVTSNASCVTGNPAVSPPLVMVVSQVLPVSVSIQPSVNPVCQGNTVVFTATPVNGGSTAVYQWTLNGFPVGTNNPLYSCIPADGDVVQCKLFSSLLCRSVFPAISNAVIMTVNPNTPVSVSISASANPVCISSPVTLTAIPYNGGTSPVYEWRVNGMVAGTNSVSHTFIPANGDEVVCLMASSASCAPPAPVMSNLIAMTVSPIVPVTVSIVPSANPVCQNVQVVYTATPGNGGITPSYQWKVNGVNSGANNPVYTNVPQDGDQVSCVLTSNATCVTGNPAVSNTVPMTVIPSAGVPVGITITPSANPSCVGQSVTYTATVVNGGSAPVYAWMVNGLDVGTNSPTYTYVPTNGDFIRCWVTSDMTCATNNPAGSNEISMTVNPFVPVSVSITSSANPSCVGSVVTYTAHAVNPGTSPVYQWKVDGVNAGLNQSTFVYTPILGNVITCKLTSSLGCTTGNPANSNSISMNVLPVLPVGITISTLTNPSCKGSWVTFNAAITNGGTSPVYQWKLNGNNVGSNNSILMFTPATGDVVTCRLTSNAICYTGNKIVTSAPINMVVGSELAPAVNISASINPFCEGSLVTFSATPTNGGTMPTYSWRVNCLPVGTTNSTFTYTPVHGDFVNCQMTSNLSCAVMNPCKSNAITMNHNSQTPVGITINASANPVCPGATVTYAATVTNGGSSPVYQWKVNGNNAGVNSPSFNFAPSNGDIITCMLTSNAPCVSGSPVTSNPVTMSVNPSLPATITITTPTNPFCTGTAVNFSAVSTNSGSSPVYQWKVNGLSSGTNSASFSYNASSGDMVTCDMTSNASCISGANPVSSNPVVMQSGTSVPVSITIQPSLNPVCAGTPVTFTSVHAGGGNNPVFSWHVNGQPAGANTPAYTYVPVNGDVVNCTLNSDLVCAPASTATSNSVIVAVNPSLPVSASIAASANPCCLGSVVTFNATVQNGGTSPAYQWFVNCLNVGTNSPDFTYVPVNGDVVVCHVNSNALCTTNNPIVTNNINMVVLPIQPVSVTVQPSFNPFCAGNPITFTASPSNGGSSPTYQWQVNHVNVGTNNPIFIYNPSDGDSVGCIMNSNALCTTGNPAASVPVRMVAISALPVTISISASSNPICYTTPVAFTATTTNGGNSPTYIWKVNGVVPQNAPNASVYQYMPAIGDVVTCQLNTSLSCAAPNPALSNPINMIVNPQMPVSVVATASANPTCSGTPVTFTAVATNGGTGPTYRWRVNGVNASGATNSTYTYSPNNNDVVYCRVTSNVNCATGNPSNSNQIVMNVGTNAPSSVNIAPSANPVCQGTIVTFTATPTNGGTAPAYQWKVNGINAGTNNPVFAFAPANGDVVRCEMLSNSICTTMLNATSNNIVMTVSPVQPVTISVLPSANPVCLNSNVTFTAIAANGGSAPQYQWKVNGGVVGTNSSSYSFIPDNGDVVTCKLTSGLACTTGNPATSLPVVMTVSTSLPVAVAVAASANPSCQGEPVTYTATPLNGGVSPVYQWMVNGINVGTNSPVFNNVPAESDQVTCKLISDFSCATGNPALSTPVVMGVNPNLPTGVSIVSTGNPVCAGSLVTFTATPANGGTTPAFQWKINGVNAGSNSPGFSYIPANGDTVSCHVTSSISCPTNNPSVSNIIVMNVVEPVLLTVGIAASQNPTCQGNQVTFTAIPENGGYNPSYQWKVNGVNVGQGLATFSYTPGNGDVVMCELTSSAICTNSTTVLSNPVVMSVSTELPVTVAIQASSNPVCMGQQVLYTASILNGGNSPSYQWMVNGINIGANQATLSFIPNDGDTIACIATSDLSCATGNPATSSPIIMSVTPVIPVGITISASANPVCLGSTVTYNAVASNAGSSPLFQWKVNGLNVGGNSPTYSYVPANGDVVTCMLNASGACSSVNQAVSNPITMTVSSDFPVNVTISASANQVCGGTPVIFTALSVNGGTGPVYQWKVNGSIAGTNSPTYSYIPLNGDLVQCIFTSGLSCASGNPATSNIIQMVVDPPQPVSVSIVANPPTAVCAGTTVALTATPVNGGTTPAYQWHLNGLVVGTNQPSYSFTPANGDQVYVVLSSNLVCSYGSPAVSDTMVMAVNAPVEVSVTAAVDQNNVCEGTQVVFTATPVNGGVPTYQWHLNGAPVGSNQPTYTCTPANGDMVFVTMTSSLPCVNTPAVSSSVITMIVNPLLATSVSIICDQNPVCQGSLVTFTATPVNGGSPAYQWFVNGAPAGTNQSTLSYIPDNGDQVHVVMTSSLSCLLNATATSNVIAMTVDPLVIVSVSMDASMNPVCTGTEVTYTATPVNGGNPAYQWYKNNLPVGSNQPVYACIPVNGDQVYVQMSSTIACASASLVGSDTVTMTVDPLLPVSVSVQESQNDICEGTSVIFTATGINGGTAIYEWFKNDQPVGTNDPVYSCIPLNGDRIQVKMTSDMTCATPDTVLSNEVEMIVNAKLSIGVSVVSDANHICQGTVVNYTAIPLNGGDATYQWYRNGLPVGTNQPQYSCAPLNDEGVNVTMTTSLACVAATSVVSDTIRVVVDTPLEVEVSIAASQDDVCEGTEVSFSATEVNGGSPLYQWFKNNIPVGDGSSQYSCTPVNGDQVKVEMTSSLTCVLASVVSSNIVSLVVRSYPQAASAITGPLSVCSGSRGVSYSIQPVTGATSYTWNLPPGVAVVSGEGTPEITLDFGDGSQSGVIIVSGKNACGNGLTSPGMQVNVVPVPIAPLVERIENSLSSNYQAGNQWYFEGVLIQDSVGQKLSPTEVGWYWSVVTENGCSSDTSNHVYFDGIFPGPVTSEPGFWVYPVPNDGHFTVAISLPAEETFTITVYNTLGVQMYKIPDVVVKSKFKQVIDLRPSISKGLFTVVFECSKYKVIKKGLFYPFKPK